MTARKVGRMWRSGVGAAMSSGLGRAIQVLLVLLGIAGLALLGIRRRWWELVALATPIVLVTVVGAASLAAPRRNEILMTLMFPLGRRWPCRRAARPYPLAGNGPQSRHLPRRTDGAARRRSG